MISSRSSVAGASVNDRFPAAAPTRDGPVSQVIASPGHMVWPTGGAPRPWRDGRATSTHLGLAPHAAGEIVHKGPATAADWTRPWGLVVELTEPGAARVVVEGSSRGLGARRLHRAIQGVGVGPRAARDQTTAGPRSTRKGSGGPVPARPERLFTRSIASCPDLPEPERHLASVRSGGFGGRRRPFPSRSAREHLT